MVNRSAKIAGADETPPTVTMSAVVQTPEGGGNTHSTYAVIIDGRGGLDPVVDVLLLG